MVVAGMTPSGADGFRRAMTRHLNHVEMSSLEGDFIAGCLANEVPREVADMLFAAVQGFAVYGFCRWHAAAFARTAYETAWLKVNHAVEFGCGLLNNQPMGFYHPSVLVEDLKRHGVTVLPVDVNRSDIRCLPEALGAAAENGQTPAGPSLLSGFLPQPADLRPGYGNFETPTTLPVKNTHGMRIGFNYVRDLGADGLKWLGGLESKKVPSTGSGRKVRVAGLVITRQAPSTAKKIRFFTLEDEFGQVNVPIKPDVYARYRQVATRQPILVIDGVMQRQDGGWSVLATQIQSLQGVARPQQRSHDYRYKPTTRSQ